MNEVACALDGCACRFPPWPDALLAVLPLALYVAITFFKAPIFANAWAIAIMPGWPLALFCAIQGLPNAPAPNAANAAAAPVAPFALAAAAAAT